MHLTILEMFASCVFFDRLHREYRMNGKKYKKKPTRIANENSTTTSDADTDADDDDDDNV
jgi:hypothetical protein